VVCEICGQREATFHFKEVINGQVRELHLCEVCAREKGLLEESFFMPDFSLSNLMTGLSSLEVPFLKEKVERCPNCSLTYEEIRKKGKIGCSFCYQTFREYLIPLLERIHGKSYHSGKVPTRKEMGDEKSKQIYRLRRELDKAIKEERYESFWLKGDGPEADIIFSSRIRLARNLRGFIFPPWADSLTLKRVSEKVLDAIKRCNYLKNARLIDMNKLSSIERGFLLERHLISVEFSRGGSHRFLVVQQGEMLSVMINEEDHLRLQTIFSGLQLREAWRVANKLDDELSENLDYAFSPQFGYLTSCPTNVGTGMRASCMVHLPALVMAGKINELLKGISQLGLVARGLYGEGTASHGDFFQISNQVTLGLKEEEVVDNVERVTRQVVGQERKAREILLKRNGSQLKDQIGRAYGILTNAHLISSQEAINLLSKLRMGVSLHLLPEFNMRVLNELLFLIGPAQLQIKSGKNLDASSRDELRAKIIREKLTGSY